MLTYSTSSINVKMYCCGHSIMNIFFSGITQFDLFLTSLCYKSPSQSASTSTVCKDTARFMCHSTFYYYRLSEGGTHQIL